MKRKKIFIQIGSLVLSVFFVFLCAFMIGSKGGKYPLFFLNCKTVKEMEIRILPEVKKGPNDKDDDKISDFIKLQYLADYNSKEYKLKLFESDKDWKYKRCEIFYMKPFGKITVSYEFDLKNAQSMNKRKVSINGVVFETES